MDYGGRHQVRLLDSNRIQRQFTVPALEIATPRLNTVGEEQQPAVTLCRGKQVTLLLQCALRVLVQR